MNDARLGIVRLVLPDGRAVALQFTYGAVDKNGHQWLLDRFKIVQQGGAGASQALGDLLGLATGNAIAPSDVMTAPMAAYPLTPCLEALWDAWKLAQYGPTGRSAEDGTENPRSRRPIRWSSLFGRRAGRA